jgi:hypothetical protein
MVRSCLKSWPSSARGRAVSTLSCSTSSGDRSAARGSERQNDMPATKLRASFDSVSVLLDSVEPIEGPLLSQSGRSSANNLKVIGSNPIQDLNPARGSTKRRLPAGHKDSSPRTRLPANGKTGLPRWFRDVANLRHRAKHSRHHTKDKQRFVVSVVAYDSLPGHQSYDIPRFSTTLYDAAPIRERNVVRQLIDCSTLHWRSLVTWRGLIRRMGADAAGAGAVVRKPPVKETAIGGTCGGAAGFELSGLDRCRRDPPAQLLRYGTKIAIGRKRLWHPV